MGFLRIPNIAGIKAFVQDLSVQQELLICSRGDLEILNGFDELLFQSLSGGLGGAIGSTYNYLPELSVAIYDAWKAGDYDRAVEIQKHVCDILLPLRGMPILMIGRYILQKRGFDMGPPRKPMRSISAEAKAKVDAVLEKNGLGVGDVWG